MSETMAKDTNNTTDIGNSQSIDRQTYQQELLLLERNIHEGAVMSIPFVRKFCFCQSFCSCQHHLQLHALSSVGDPTRCTEKAYVMNSIVTQKQHANMSKNLCICGCWISAKRQLCPAAADL